MYLKIKNNLLAGQETQKSRPKVAKVLQEYYASIADEDKVGIEEEMKVSVHSTKNKVRRKFEFRPATMLVYSFVIRQNNTND